MANRMSLLPDDQDGDLSTVSGPVIQQTTGEPPRTAQLGIGMTRNDVNPQSPSSSSHGSYQERLLLIIAAVSGFLAPIVIVSGMAASHGDNWKGAFVG
jgi:hypothetical protein